MPEPAPQHTRRVLVIDNDPMIDAVLKPYLNQYGFATHIMGTAADGLNDALAHPPSLILLSVTLPDRAGLDVFRTLRERARTAHIPVMFLADHMDSRRQNELLSAGADDFISKPFDLDILGLRIRNTVQRTERDGVHHPRTGFPAGRLVQERIRALADEYGWCKIDFSIDNFGVFRDLYGFVSSEEVIGFTANLVNEVVHQAGTPDDFIGQRDDTDFVIITTLTHGPALRDMLVKRFNDEVLAFYSFMERDQGYIQVDDGSGGLARKPLMAARIKVQEGEPD